MTSSPAEREALITFCLINKNGPLSAQGPFRSIGTEGSLHVEIHVGIEFLLDFLGRLFREQRDHHDGDAGEHECRQELIYAEPAAEGFSRLCHAKTDAAPTSIPAIPPWQRRALPVQGEQHEGAKRRTEAAHA